jgi:hypothetical protein
MATKVKSKQISDVGQMLIDAKDDLDLAFDKIKDLILEDGVLVYRKLIVGTLTRKDREEQRSQIRTHIGPYVKMFGMFKEQILQKDLTWLMENEVNITTGKSKKANLPLSKVYAFCLRKNKDGVDKKNDRLDSIEAHLFFIFKYVCDGKADPESRKKIDAICAEYDVEEDDSAKRAVDNVVNRVSKLTKGGSLGSNQQDIASIVQALIGDGGAQGGMGGMGQLAEGLLSGKVTIPELIGQVKNSIESQQGEQQNEDSDAPQSKQSDPDDKGKDEATEDVE